MVTIDKNKGSKSDPEMYRGITLHSCSSKTVSAILNNRLNDYTETCRIDNKITDWFSQKNFQPLTTFLHCIP
jgi:hypothetical protein